MKYLSDRTMRGQFEVVGNVGKLSLIIDDGLINRGYRVKYLDVWPNQVSASGHDFQSILTMDTLPSPPTMDASDNRQIAWSFAEGTATGSVYRSIIDPDHVAVRDLFIQTQGDNGVYNYLIVIELMQLTDDEAIVQIIKEESQSVP